MSKLSFRARALDASKTLPVYRGDEIPDIPEFTAINRAVPTMPTGMEKEEESEHHLQRALSAQQVYGTAEALIIPVPDIVNVEERYKKLYYLPKEFKPPRQYVHVQPWGMDMDIPDYDMDSEDDTWLNKQVKKMDISHLKFEKMMDRLEKGSGQTVVTLPEAKALLREDDDLTIAIYDYWLNKRLRLQHSLIPTVKNERRDGSTTNNPYVAFRRRTEKMQTRKNRKNDEISYERMLKLKRDLNRVLTILELMKRREKSKKEVLQLSIEIVDKRYQMEDWNSAALSEALALRHKLPPLISIPPTYEWHSRQEPSLPSSQPSVFERQRKPKREYKKRKHTKMFRLSNDHHHTSITPGTSVANILPIQPSLPSSIGSSLYSGDIDIMSGIYSSEEEMPTPVPLVVSDPEPEVEEPDGNFTFKRKAGCAYFSATPNVEIREDMPSLHHRYQLLSVRNNRCIGYVRRRLGRGGRIMFDRVQTEYSQNLQQLHKDSDNAQLYRDYIAEHRIPHYMPRIGNRLSPKPSEEQKVILPIKLPLQSTNNDLSQKQNKYRPVLKMIKNEPTEPPIKTETTIVLNNSRNVTMKQSANSQLESVLNTPVKESTLYNALTSSSLLLSNSCPSTSLSSNSVTQLAMASPSKSLKRNIVPQSVFSH